MNRIPVTFVLKSGESRPWYVNYAVPYEEWRKEDLRAVADHMFRVLMNREATTDDAGSWQWYAERVQQDDVAGVRVRVRTAQGEGVADVFEVPWSQIFDDARAIWAEDAGGT